jgi:hypothetical protein
MKQRETRFEPKLLPHNFLFGFINCCVNCNASKILLLHFLQFVVKIFQKYLIVLDIKKKHICFNLKCYIIIVGARGSVVVKALCYKLEGRGFDS